MQASALFYNANVLTMNEAQPRASAVAVFGDRIAAVGEQEQVRAAFAAERSFDLRGRMLVPGFNDAHNHMVSFGMSLDDIPLQSPPIESLDDIYAAVARRAGDSPPGSWLVGTGYDQNKLWERRHPSAQELDRVAPEHFVWLKHNSGHMCVVNGKVLAAIGIDDAQVPAGGVVVRDAQGHPTGLLQEQAQTLLRPLVYPVPVERLVAAIERAGRHYLREGITSCQEAGVGGQGGASPLVIRAFQDARRSGKLVVRTTLMIAADALHDVGRHERDGDSFALDLGLHTGFGDEWLRIGGIKIFADGSLIGRTAAMVEDFADDAGNRGFFQTDPATLRTTIIRAHRSGWQVGTHAIGDRAVATVLDIYAEALRQQPRADHRHRIEHCGVIDDRQLERLHALGVIPVPQGRFIEEIGDGMAAALGPERTRWAYRQRSFLERGIPLPGSSDRPVVNGSPLLGIHAMVNQQTSSGQAFNPAEALTPLEALRCYTLGSAYATFEEHRKGSIAAGKLADFAVLSDDITAIDRARIGATRVLATIVGGQVVFDEMGLLGL